ncbi:MAG TPA: glycosyltransferase [Pseudolabrys sp.]|nr:glycosyltransferase [Pseudolabrys sp.]
MTKAQFAKALRITTQMVRQSGGFAPLALKCLHVLQNEGLGGFRRRLLVLRRNVPDDRSEHNREAPSRPPGIAPADVPKALANAQRWCSDESPEVSILIINWNATQLTLECVRQIWANTEGVFYEIIIVDNGSDPRDIVPLRSLGSGARLVELGINRFFGEANNIAAEHARGKYLCFVNNDAFVQPGWLRTLVEAIEDVPAVGAVGPMFLFPDNTLQEAGCTVDENGYPTRLGRHLNPADSEFNVAKFVDYISAATMLVEKRLFINAGGFDLAYEPAYYEDIDLCFKLLAMGRRTRYCPAAKVIHIEGSSANDSKAAQDRRKALGDLNRDKFVDRWQVYLKTRSEDAISQPKTCGPRPRNDAVLPLEDIQRERVAVYTSFALTPGGGERYILTLAAALSNKRQVSIVTPHPYSHLRLRNLGREFGVDLSQCDLMTYETLVRNPRPDFMFTLGNHIVPPVPAYATNSWYLCQFPFGLDAGELERRRDTLAGYRGVNVYSDYTKKHVLRLLKEHQLPSIPVDVMYPPVPHVQGDASRKKNIILTVGRFFVGGHSKRQDLMIAAFRSVIKNFDGDVEFHLAGSSMPEPLHMAFIDDLKQMAHRLPVKFHINPTTRALAELYRDAAVYWHATGLHSNIEREPEKAEHFGISIVEAMSAACVPFAFNGGGPREIISNGVDGFLYDTTEQLVEQTMGLLGDRNIDRRIQLGNAAGIAAERYKVGRFVSTVRRLVDDVDKQQS